jgi:phosphate starvation-inducible PhoH-like protein
MSRVRSRILEKDELSEKVTPIKRADKQRYPQKLKTDSISFKNKCTPKTAAQEYYMQTMEESIITICSSPAGTGKTYLAVYFALQQLLSKQVDKIVITRPIIEASESSKIGYLKGGIDEKTDVYNQIVIDLIEKHIGIVMTEKLMEEGRIKFKPLAYMRGAEFSDCVIIADECQNFTKKDLKLLMTRIGENSKLIINGDTDQCDLVNPKMSGLSYIIECLTGKSEDIGVCEMSYSDIQRHPLISLILKNLT